MSGAPKPSDEHGRELARFDRDNGVIVWRQRRYNGRDFVDVRLFIRGPDGREHPTARGISIRVSEVGRVAALLTDVKREIEGAASAAKDSARAAREDGATDPDWLTSWRQRQERRGR
jgi:hypothetical protein